MTTRRPSPQLSEQQLAVMRALWKLGEASAAEVREALDVEPLPAPTTVTTALARLEKRGLVAHAARGRLFVYRALITEEEARSGMVRELTQRLFAGDLAQHLDHLLASRDVRPGDLERIRRRIEERARELEGRDER